jgi:hypothetical protein
VIADCRLPNGKRRSHSIRQSAIGNFANDYFPQHGGQHSSHSGGQQPPHRFRIPVTALSNAHIMGTSRERDCSRQDAAG